MKKMADSMTIQKGTLQESLILPLYGRYVANKNFPQVFEDTKAFEIIKRIRYDFHSIDMKTFAAIIYGLRHEQLVTSAKNFLKKHPYSIIVNLGCGLDTSFSFIDNGRCRYVNLDLPEVIEMREKLFSLRPREMNLPADALDISWMDRLGAQENQHVYIISGGFLYYLKSDEARSLIAAMASHFRSGGMAFDFVSDRFAKVAGSTFEGLRPKMHFFIKDAKKEIPAISSSIESVDLIERLADTYSCLPLLSRMKLNRALSNGTLGFAEARFR